MQIVDLAQKIIVENGQKNIVELQKFGVPVDVEFSEKKVVECRIQG